VRDPIQLKLRPVRQIIIQDSATIVLVFSGGSMKIVCKCGMDCTDFCSQHAIPLNARFACPDCDSPLTASASQGGAQSAGFSVSERRPEDSLTSSRA